MKGLKIDFPPVEMKDTKASFDFTTYRDGFEHTVQKAIFNTVTIRGTDYAYPERGDVLQRNLAGLSLGSEVELRHASNFAALSAKTFTNNNMDESDETIREYVLIPEPKSIGSVTLYANLTGSNGSVSQTYLSDESNTYDYNR